VLKVLLLNDGLLSKVAHVVRDGRERRVVSIWRLGRSRKGSRVEGDDGTLYRLRGAVGDLLGRKELWKARLVSVGRIFLEGSYCRLGPVEAGRHPAWPVLRTDILHGLKKKAPVVIQGNQLVVLGGVVVLEILVEALV